MSSKPEPWSKYILIASPESAPETKVLLTFEKKNEFAKNKNNDNESLKGRKKFAT